MLAYGQRDNTIVVHTHSSPSSAGIIRCSWRRVCIEQLAARWVPLVIAFMVRCVDALGGVGRWPDRAAQLGEFPAVSGPPANSRRVAELDFYGEAGDTRRWSPVLSAQKILAGHEVRLHVRTAEGRAADAPPDRDVLNRLLAGVEQPCGDQGRGFIAAAYRGVHLARGHLGSMFCRSIFLVDEHAAGLRTPTLLVSSLVLFLEKFDFLGLVAERLPRVVDGEPGAEGNDQGSDSADPCWQRD